MFTLQTLPACKESLDDGLGQVVGFLLHASVAAKADQRLGAPTRSSSDFPVAAPLLHQQASARQKMTHWRRIGNARIRDRSTSMVTRAPASSSSEKSSNAESTCPLAALGYSRDNKRGKLHVNYGLLTDSRGCPIAISVHEGNTADCATFAPMVEHVRKDFQLEQIVMVRDRGMIPHKAIQALQQLPGVDWITALKNISIKSLMNKGHLQIDLFDDTNLFELSSPDYPNERLIACRIEALAKRRALELIDAIEL